MKFRKITRILAVMAFATLMQATQAYADIIKIDAISLDSNPDVFMKFDDKLGSLIDVTYYYSGSTYAEIYYGEFDVGVAANDWVEGLTLNKSTYISHDITCVPFCADLIENRILVIPSFDIFLGLNIYSIDFEFELSIPLIFASEDFGAISHGSAIRSQSAVFDYMSSSYCIRDGNNVSYIDDMRCFFNEIMYASRVEYTYDDAVFTTVSTPSTLAIFALGLMGIMSRRFKKQS